MSDPNLPPPQTPPPTMDYQPATGGLFAPPPIPAIPAPAEDRSLGMLCHLLALAGLTAIPFANVLGPLIIWLMKKDQSTFVNDQGKESLNFQITASIIIILSSPLFCVGVGFVVVPLLAVGALVLAIIGGIQASSGQWYRYPFALRLIK